MTERNIYKDILFGVAVGDALGVPVEFKSRQTISLNPVNDMTGYGTYNLPAGTFSDDSSLAFCLAEALIQEFNLQRIGNNFVAWLNNNYWTPRGAVFDVGIAISQAIRRLQGGCNPELIYKNSQPVQETKHKFLFGSIIKSSRIKKGLSQQDLATLSGTSKTYISRIENDLIEPEFSTLYKIVELGLGKKIKVEIA